jgi:hypothetical protein
MGLYLSKYDNMISPTQLLETLAIDTLHSTKKVHLVLPRITRKVRRIVHPLNATSFRVS